MCVRPLWHCETLKLSWGGADALWWSVCVYHLSLCVNILLGNSPSISSGMTTFSPLCLPTGHTAHKFYSDKSSELVMHCTQYDSQRWLLKTDLSTAGGGSNWTQAASADWHLPLPMLGNGVWYARPGFLGASPGVGGGGLYVLMAAELLSCWVGHFRPVNRWSILQLSNTAQLLINSQTTFTIMQILYPNGHVIKKTV